jgi:zinc protease
MKVNRTEKPLPKGDIEFHLPEIKSYKLDNGLNILFVQKEKLPVVQLNLVINGGSKFDNKNEKGLSYLTSMLIDEGAGEYDSLQLDNEFEKLGTVKGISVDQDLIYLSLLSLKEHFDRSTELFSKIVKSPALKKEDFEREKVKLLTKTMQLKDKPSYLADIAFDKLVMKGSSYIYPTIGYDQNIEELTHNDTDNFYRKHFYANNATLIVVGSLNENELLDTLSSYFEEWEHTEEIPSLNQQVEMSPSNIYLVNKPDAPQSELRIGHNVGKRNDKDFFDLKLLNAVLGGQFSSRINLNLREDKGYTYGAHSTFNFLKDSGFFEVSTSVETKNTGASVKEIYKEIEGVKKEIHQSELDFAKSYLIKKYPSQFETYSQVAQNLTAMVLHSLNKNYFDNYISNLEKVDLNGMKSAADKYLITDKLQTLIVGDKEKLEPQLKELTDKEIIELDNYGDKIN